MADYRHNSPVGFGLCSVVGHGVETFSYLGSDSSDAVVEGRVTYLEMSG